MKKAYKVILLIETSHTYGRGLLRGIARYSSHHGSWSVYRPFPHYGKHVRSERNISKLKRINADGMIIREPAKIEDFMALGIPMIISPSLMNPDIPTILTNAGKIGVLGAEHLLERGFKNFAFCAFGVLPWSLNRLSSFKQRIQKAGFQVEVFSSSVKKIYSPSEKDRERLDDWLRSLPKPIGMMTCNDDMGRAILEACKLTEIRVPEQIAVVGIDDDELTCELTDPPLSSVALRSEKAGYDAAELLDRLMHGEKMKGQIINHDPSHVVTRHSTDILAIRDGDVIDALQYIRANTLKSVQVSDVVKHVCMTRQTLNKKFQKTLGRSIHSEITRLRINIARKLLIETNMSVSDISYKMNFSDIKSLSRLFKKETGLSPLQFRRKNS
ncbi:MAG: DNA-binding transcriptional regulator [Planctomycetota bacterium]